MYVKTESGYPEVATMCGRAASLEAVYSDGDKIDFFKTTMRLEGFGDGRSEDLTLSREDALRLSFSFVSFQFLFSAQRMKDPSEKTRGRRKTASYQIWFDSSSQNISTLLLLHFSHRFVLEMYGNFPIGSAAVAKV